MVSFVTTDEFSVRITKITSRICVSWTRSLPFCFLTYLLTQWIMTILSKGSKPDKYESQSSLKLCFTNSHDLHSNFVEWESFLESNSHDIPTLRETNLDDRLHALLPPFLDVTRMSMSIVSFLPQLNSGILCL